MNRKLVAKELMKIANLIAALEPAEEQGQKVELSREDMNAIKRLEENLKKFGGSLNAFKSQKITDASGKVIEEAQKHYSQLIDNADAMYTKAQRVLEQAKNGNITEEVKRLTHQPSLNPAHS